MDDSSATISDDLHNLLFGVRRSIRYHTRRWQFYDGVSMWCKFLSVLGGTATITAVLAKLGQGWTIGFASVVTIFSVMDLIVGSGQKARLHNDFVRQFVDLEKDIVTKEQITESDMRSFTGRRLVIEAQEPPPLRILDMICHNELCRALGYDENKQVRIKWYQRLFCQLVDIGDQSVVAPKCS
jgi:hypothetical protein